MTRVIGVDFGTTNSVVALLDPDGRVRTSRSGPENQSQEPFRTVICFWNETVERRDVLRHAAGPRGIQAYLEDPLDSRLIMSMKTYLAQKSFRSTNIFGRPYTLEQTVALFLRDLLGSDLESVRIIAGRPVRFAGEIADDALGEARLRKAFSQAGFPSIDIALEPEAAGYRFARTLDRAAIVLIGDLGGGTSDFSLLRFNPGVAKTVEYLGHGGVGVAGDAFDYRIIDNVISPLLGKGGVYTSMGKVLPIPSEYFAAFARWHRVSVMRTPRTMREIEEIARTSAESSRLRQLIQLIEDESGYRIYQAVNKLKAELSHAPEATFRFTNREFAVERTVAREEFELWIKPDLRRISNAIEDLLNRSGIDNASIDRVFLTGGTSFVPAVRQLFLERFAVERISAGGEFVSVAEGLALLGRDRLLLPTA